MLNKKANSMALCVCVFRISREKQMPIIIRMKGRRTRDPRVFVEVEIVKGQKGGNKGKGGKKGSEFAGQLKEGSSN